MLVTLRRTVPPRCTKHGPRIKDPKGFHLGLEMEMISPNLLSFRQLEVREFTQLSQLELLGGSI